MSPRDLSFCAFFVFVFAHVTVRQKAWSAGSGTDDATETL